MKKNILVPDIGDFDNVEIIEVLVKEGQKIQKNDSIVTLESDKSSVEVPSTEEGDVLKILVKVGDKVSKGDKLVEIQSASEKKPEPEKKEVKNLDIPKDTEKPKAKNKAITKSRYLPMSVMIATSVVAIPIKNTNIRGNTMKYANEAPR